MSTSFTTGDGRTFHARPSNGDPDFQRIRELEGADHGTATWSTVDLMWSYRDRLFPSLHDVLRVAARGAARDLHDAMTSGSAR